MDRISCQCGATPKWDRTFRDRQGRRVIHTERLLCPACGTATPWVLASINGEHRPELSAKWESMKSNKEILA